VGKNLSIDVPAFVVAASTAVRVLVSFVTVVVAVVVAVIDVVAVVACVLCVCNWGVVGSMGAEK
jgi:hypothetical protein